MTERKYAVVHPAPAPGMPTTIEGPYTLGEIQAKFDVDDNIIMVLLTPVDAHGGTIEPELRSADVWPL